MKKKLRYWWVIAKFSIFLFAAVIFMPMVFIIGGEEFSQGLKNGVQGFIDELYEHGVIDKNQKESIEKDIF